jgi:hypothetical protein
MELRVKIFAFLIAPAQAWIVLMGKLCRLDELLK